MVFIRNINRAHAKLKKGCLIKLYFKSGNTIDIKEDDKLLILNGDLKVTRFHKNEFLCQMVIDCQEIEYYIVTKEN